MDNFVEMLMILMVWRLSMAGLLIILPPSSFRSDFIKLLTVIQLVMPLIMPIMESEIFWSESAPVEEIVSFAMVPMTALDATHPMWLLMVLVYVMLLLDLVSPRKPAAQEIASVVNTITLLLQPVLIAMITTPTVEYAT